MNRELKQVYDFACMQESVLDEAANQLHKEAAIILQSQATGVYAVRMFIEENYSELI